MKKKLEKGCMVVINFEGTLFEGNDFIAPIGVIEKVLNDAIRDASYLVNGFWWEEKKLICL